MPRRLHDQARCGLTFELTPTAEAGGARLVRDDAPSAADQPCAACRSGSGVERGVRQHRQVHERASRPQDKRDGGQAHEHGSVLKRAALWWTRALDVLMDLWEGLGERSRAPTVVGGECGVREEEGDDGSCHRGAPELSEADVGRGCADEEQIESGPELSGTSFARWHVHGGVRARGLGPCSEWVSCCLTFELRRPWRQVGLAA